VWVRSEEYGVGSEKRSGERCRGVSVGVSVGVGMVLVLSVKS